MKRNKLQFIWICGMPRSGTSWLSQIFESHPNVRFRLEPLFSYSYKDRIDVTSSRDAILQFFQESYNNFTDEFMLQLDKRVLGDYPIFSENERPEYYVQKYTRYHNLVDHLAEMVPEIKFIYIVRDPRASISSWLSAKKEFPSSDDRLKYWRNGLNRKKSVEEFWGFDDWITLTKKYMQKAKYKPGQFLVVRYEDLLENPVSEVLKMFKFVGLNGIPESSKSFINESRTESRLSEYAVFKDASKQKGKWRKTLEESIQNEILNELKQSHPELLKYCES